MNDLKRIKHLYARAGFGLSFGDLHAGIGSYSQEITNIFTTSKDATPINVVTENVDMIPRQNLTPEQKKQISVERHTQEITLNSTWVEQMGTKKSQLREKMTLFWHNHFSCNIGSPYYEQQLNNIQRKYALGNFKVLLLEVSKSPAVLQFLNNQQNHKQHPNENFARELMELFTVGRGNYTEDDIKASARAFTGWSYDVQTGDFVFKQNVHDEGSKTFMGKTGNFKGEDIIDIILTNKQTAKFISTKLYAYLINEIPNADHIQQMADVFYNSNYEIGELLEFVFKANWFYDEKNIGNLIKSPIQLLVGLDKQFGVQYHNPDILLQFQRTLGQLLFRPPNVAGWPGGRRWIDGSSLMYRMKIPSLILNSGVIDFTGKTDPEGEAYLAINHLNQSTTANRTQTEVNWDGFLKTIPPGFSKTQIAEIILEPSINNTLLNKVKYSPDIKGMIIQLVSTPEYQLC